VLSLKLFQLYGVPAWAAKGAQIRLKTGSSEAISNPCKAMDPGNVHGFGQVAAKQMTHLLKNGVSPKLIAETWNVGEEVVEEVARHQAKEYSWFRWDQALYVLLSEGEGTSLQIEIRLASKRTSDSPWLPLGFSMAKPLSDVLKETRSSVADPERWSFQHSDGQGSVGIALQLLNSHGRGSH